MRALLAILLIVTSGPALAGECRYFSPDGSTSLTSNEEDEIVIIHRASGDEVCGLAPTETVLEFVISCDGWTKRLAYVERPSTGAEFGDEFWRRECFENA